MEPLAAAALWVLVRSGPVATSGDSSGAGLDLTSTGSGPLESTVLLLSSDAALRLSFSFTALSVSRLSGDSCLPSRLKGLGPPPSPPAAGGGDGVEEEEEEDGDGGAGPFSPSISSRLCRLCSQWKDSRR